MNYRLVSRPSRFIACHMFHRACKLRKTLVLKHQVTSEITCFFLDIPAGWVRLDWVADDELSVALLFCENGGFEPTSSNPGRIKPMTSKPILVAS